MFVILQTHETHGISASAPIKDWFALSQADNLIVIFAFHEKLTQFCELLYKEEQLVRMRHRVIIYLTTTNDIWFHMIRQGQND